MFKKTLTLVSVALLSACAPRVALKKDLVTRDQNILVVLHDSEASVTYEGAASGIGMMFGAIGGAIAGSIDATKAAQMARTLKSKLGGLDLGNFVQKEFIVEASTTVAWKFQPVATTLTPDERKDLEQYLEGGADNVSSSSMKISADRPAESEQKSERRMLMEKVLADLNQHDISRVLVLNINFWGFSSQSGYGDYTVDVTGKAFAPEKPDSLFWSMRATSGKSNPMRRGSLNFDEEMKKDSAAIQAELMKRGSQVAEKLASDFK